MREIYSLDPVAVFVFILLFDFLTLLIVAIKLKSVKTLFKNPGFFLGDFIVLPFAASLVSNFYQSFSVLPQELFSAEFNLINLFLALIISIAFGIHFKIIKNYWLPLYWWPHGLFHVVYVYIISLFVMVALDRKSTRLNSSHQIISYAVF